MIDYGSVKLIDKVANRQLDKVLAKRGKAES
jgi:hypothetical protein